MATFLAALALVLSPPPVPPPGVDCRVPRVVGMTFVAARRIIRGAGCDAVVLYRVYSPEPRGEVLRQRPRPGEWALGPVSRVKLWVSRGRRP